ncbi:MAG TPA: hypothetical protein VHM20_05190, partial [Gammaproteobacteria bacterium]|nr:hypothetical protein [Gammaproteobacteria bacterium]
HYEYDDVGNNIKFSNRLNQITNFYYDRAKRKTLEVYPSASYTKVYRNEHGKLFYETSYISPQKHINYDKNNNIIQITVGDGRDDYRVVKSKYNAYRQTLNTVVPAVNINDEEAHYDDSWQGLLTLPHRKVNLDTNTIYDTKGNIYAEKDENDHWTYKIYNSLNHVIFTINREKAITRYANNSFGNPLEEYHYAKPIDLDLNEYREVGLTAEIILQNIQTDENDRVTSFQYNQAGKLIQQQSNQIFYYSRGEYGLAKPTIRKEYNPFDDCIYEAKLIRQNIWSEKRSWFDKMKNIVAEVNENNYLTYYQFNSANKPTEIREYSEPFIVQPACSVDVNQLIEMITTSTKDRVHRYTYDALQQKKTETLLDVTTHKLILDDKNIPHIEQNPSKNLMKEWFYSPTQKIIKIQHVDGNEENFYYDAGDNRIAETEVVRQSVDDTGKSISILPMKQFKLNVFKEPVVLSTSPQGGIIEDNSPRLICDKPQDCIEEVRLYDNRGLIYLKQDNEQHLVGFTYQPFRKVARLLQEASNWRLSSDEKKIFNRENYIDEKEIFYNQNYQPNKINLRRNGRLVESTFNHYNVFGDSIGEGAAENKDSAIHRFDNVGSAWFTNGEKGVNTIIFRDLLGNETLRLQAPNDNLAEFSYDHLSTLLTWGADRVDFAETIHDQGGRVIAHKTPIWFKDCNSQPSRSYQYDRWNNVIKEINSLGFQTDYAFNSLDKMTQCIQPETDVYFENMTQSRVRPTAQHAYNERGFEIGIMDANAHVTGFILDNAGNILKNILPDGTIEETTIFDSLNRPTHLIDARNKVTQYFYNSKSQVTAQRYPSGRLIQYEYDERDNRVSYCDPADNTWRYNYDLQGNMIERFMPLGQATQVSYDRNHVKIAEVNPDNSKMTWDTDYFGNILKHRDLSGKILNSTYDFNKRVIRQSSEADAPRKMLMMNGPVTNMGFVVHNCNFANVPSEDISYRYHFGLLETVQDNSLNKTSTYAYNTESKRIFMQNKKSQMVMNEVTTEYDELDREVATQEQLLEASGYYSKMALKKGYDQVGNIRMNLFTLDPTCIMAKVNCRAPQQKSAFYYLYDNADRIRVLDGKFQENKIQQGVAIEYKNGFRHTENVYGSGVTTFEYDDDGRLTETIADNGMKTVRIYDPAGWTQAYQEILGSQSTQRHLNFNENGWQLTDDFFENNKQQTAMSYLNLTPLGLPTKQAIYDYKQKYNDVYEITYLGLDRWAQAKVTGKRNDG